MTNSSAVVLEEAQTARAWYALYTRHQHEKAVDEILRNKGFETFLPLYETVHRWRDRNKRVSLPVYPCYVFIRGGVDRRVQILTTPGIHWIVGVGGCACPIPDSDIEAVRRLVSTQFRVEPHPYLRTGDRIRVIAGPLEGMEGILARKKNVFRLVLSVDMIMKSVAVEVDASMVERLEPQREPRIGERLGKPSLVQCGA